MEKQLNWSRELLTSYPQVEVELKSWVRKKMEETRAEIGKQLNVDQSSFPEITDLEINQFTQVLLATNYFFFLDFFDEKGLNLTMGFEEQKNKYYFSTHKGGEQFETRKQMETAAIEHCFKNL